MTFDENTELDQLLPAPWPVEQQSTFLDQGDLEIAKGVTILWPSASPQVFDAFLPIHDKSVGDEIRHNGTSLIASGISYQILRFLDCRCDNQVPHAHLRVEKNPA